MSETHAPSNPVAWREDGTPMSAQFGDIYRNAGSGLAQARHVFLGGCGLLTAPGRPAIWAGAARWGVLENGFGLGLNFLATWAAWAADPDRPAQLFYTAIEAYPPRAQDVLRSAAPFPVLNDAARALVAQWHGLTRGAHRLEFADGRIQLTLVVHDAEHAVREITGRYESLYLDGFAPDRNPAMWSPRTLAGLARLAAPGAFAATWCVAHRVREALGACGFHVERVAGLPPKREALRAHYASVHVRANAGMPVRLPRMGTCAVVGAGLAGAAAARSLARRGWRVTVFDASNQPAAGASAVPAGLLVPHVTPDDDPLAQLSRAGIRATLEYARATLREGVDFAAGGVLERHAPDKRHLPPDWPTADSDAANASDSSAGGSAITRRHAAAIRIALDEDHPALWHARAGWMRPAALVHALLATPGIRFHGNTAIRSFHADGTRWALRPQSGRALGAFDLVVVAAGQASAALLGAGDLPLRPLAGQIAYGSTPLPDAPAFPVNGEGYWIPLPFGADGARWLIGSTFERDKDHAVQSASAHIANADHMRRLLPPLAPALHAAWQRGAVRAWSGVRAALPDHLPAIGPLQRPRFAPCENAPAPIQLCTGLGARGLSLAILCAEVLAARLHGEPLPIARPLAERLLASRFTHATAIPHDAHARPASSANA